MTPNLALALAHIAPAYSAAQHKRAAERMTADMNLNPAFTTIPLSRKAASKMMDEMEKTTHADSEPKNAGFQVTYTIPDGMSDDEAIEYIKKHLGALNDMHRAMGGSGLKVLSCKVQDLVD